MRRLGVILNLLLVAVMPCRRLAAQEAAAGVAVPVTITGGAMVTNRGQADDPAAAPFSAAFRLLATPELKLGPHWYFYTAVQVRSTPFFYQDAYDAGHSVKADLLQGFMGYTRAWGRTQLNLKAGKLSSAFGAFPLRYDDAANPLLDQPLPYTYLAMWPRPGAESYGLTPVTLYGLWGAEAALSWRRVDTRFQWTNSNPYNPQGLSSSAQCGQWTAGAGYTIRQGFRVGVSAYHGPWLNSTFAAYLPAGATLGQFPSSGLGVDVQWARGRWSASGEWERFAFSFPRSATAAIPSFAYLEMKRIISPRWYAALRANTQTDNAPPAADGQSFRNVFPNRQAYEFAVGLRPDHFQLVKVGYEWMKLQGAPRNQDNVLGVQFVTSINSLSKAFH